MNRLLQYNTAHYVKNLLIKIILVSFSLILVCQKSNGQQFFSGWEFGAGVGVGHYFGDLNPKWGLNEVRPALSLVVKKNLNPYIAIQSQLTYTRIGYKDSYSQNAFQKMRNLEFKSNIVEAAILGEFNFFWLETGKIEHRSSPFMTIGIGAFYYEPTAYFNGYNYKLRTLGTEGQNKAEYADRRYNNIGISIPFGVGYKWWFKPGMNLSVSVLNRFTLNDYLDDVSQTYIGAENFVGSSLAAKELQDRSLNHMGIAGHKRGDQSSNDQFLTAQITLTIQLKTYKCPNFESNLWKNANVSY